jgi:hypothetical protein
MQLAIDALQQSRVQCGKMQMFELKSEESLELLKKADG